MATDTDTFTLPPRALLPLNDLVDFSGRYWLIRDCRSGTYSVALPAPIDDPGPFGADVAVALINPDVHPECGFELSGGFVCDTDVDPDSFASVCAFLDEETKTLAAEGF